MDLELKHLGQTRAIGGCALFGVWHLLRILSRKRANALNAAAKLRGQWALSAVYLAVVFVLGIFLEDFSKSYAAERGFGLSWIFNLVLESDKNLRLRSLYNVERFDAGTIIATPKPIVFDLLECRNIDTNVMPFRDVIRDAMCTKNGSNVCAIEGAAQVQAFQRAINGIYYYAKNRDYRETTYFNELMAIQDRGDFARSFVLLCMILAFLYLLIVVLSQIPYTASKLKIGSNGRNRAIVMFLVYLCGVFLARITYESEQTNYNLRVVGYYICLKQDPGDGKR